MFEILDTWEPDNTIRHKPSSECSGLPEDCECGEPIIKPLTGFDMYTVNKYLGNSNEST